MKPNRILIVGCARSGNTLMLYLMTEGFGGMERQVGETGEVVPEAKPGVVAVGKFPRRASILDEIGLLDQEDLGIIYMMRDPRDVLTSLHPAKPNNYWVQPARWKREAQAALKFQSHERVLLVRFEDLLKEPALSQERIARKFDLKIAMPFAEAHSWTPKSEGDMINVTAMHGIRPLDPAEIGSWQDNEKDRTHVEHCLWDMQLVTLMKQFGY